LKAKDDSWWKRMYTFDFQRGSTELGVVAGLQDLISFGFTALTIYIHCTVQARLRHSILVPCLHFCFNSVRGVSMFITKLRIQTTSECFPLLSGFY
jgi:hypothetical protein